MNIIRWSFANGIRRTRWLSFSSLIHRDLNNPPLFHPSLSPLRNINRPLPYNLRALSDDASSSSIHEDVKPEPKQTGSQEKHTEEEKKTTHDIKDDQTRVLQAALEHVVCMYLISLLIYSTCFSISANLFSLLITRV